jgi:hypothetical protein
MVRLAHGTLGATAETEEVVHVAKALISVAGRWPSVTGTLALVNGSPVSSERTTMA